MRSLTAPIVLAAAVGVPYAATNAPDFDVPWATPSAVESSVLPEQATGIYPKASQADPLATSGTVMRSTVPLSEVLRFDITRAWVVQRWERKTTALSELDLFGIRVPLVTGTALHDIAGSLTYYFDQQGVLQRISLVGRTGNTTQLEQLVTSRYGLQLQPTAVAGERLYQIRSGQYVYSELYLRPAAVLWTKSPHGSFSVNLQLQRPGTATPLPSKPMTGILDDPPKDGSVEKSTDAAEKSEDAKEKTDENPWESYRPRSQLPAGQLENLDRRDHYW